MIINVEKKLVEYIEALEQENKQLKEEKRKVIEFIKINVYENIYNIKVVNANDLLEILGGEKE